MRDPTPMGTTPRGETANLTPFFADHAATRRDSVARPCRIAPQLDGHAGFFPSYRP